MILFLKHSKVPVFNTFFSALVVLGTGICQTTEAVAAEEGVRAPEPSKRLKYSRCELLAARNSPHAQNPSPEVVKKFDGVRKLVERSLLVPSAAEETEED